MTFLGTLRLEGSKASGGFVYAIIITSPLGILGMTATAAMHSFGPSICRRSALLRLAEKSSTVLRIKPLPMI